jgi:hypothetical protein
VNPAKYTAAIVGQFVVGVDEGPDLGVVVLESLSVAVAGGAVDVLVQ